MIRFLAVTALLAAAVSGQQRSLKAHVHGHATLNIAFESTSAAKPTGEMEFEAPAESIVGFEHEAKTPADKAKQDTALANLEARFREMVLLPSSCRITAEKARMEREETHSSVHANFHVACSAPIAGQKVAFAFARVFPKIERVEVQLIAGSQQSSLSVKTDQGVILFEK